MTTTTELQKMIDQATPGPWEADIHGDEGTVDVISCDGVYGATSANDARLIAQAPDLAAEVIRMREGIEAYIRDLSATRQDRTLNALLENGLRALLDGGQS
ncbi:MAG: hypothetical protein ACTH9H_13130 [Galactobacter sp.]